MFSEGGVAIVRQILGQREPRAHPSGGQLREGRGERQDGRGKESYNLGVNTETIAKATGLAEVEVDGIIRDDNNGECN